MSVCLVVVKTSDCCRYEFVRVKFSVPLASSFHNMTYYMWGIVVSKTIIQAVIIELKAGPLICFEAWGLACLEYRGTLVDHNVFVYQKGPVWLLARSVASAFLLA